MVPFDFIKSLAYESRSLDRRMPHMFYNGEPCMVKDINHYGKTGRVASLAKSWQDDGRRMRDGTVQYVCKTSVLPSDFAEVPLEDVTYVPYHRP